MVGAALSWRLAPAQWTVVVPEHWRPEHCSATTFTEARGATRHGRPDVRVEAGSSLGLAGPLALQSRACGSPGDHIALPTSFLAAGTNLTEAQEAAMARQLAHQFVKLRFGVFDERGYPGDALYPGHYKVAGRIHPTGTTDAEVRGAWVGLEGEEGCSPDTQPCMFQPRGDNSGVTCSLGHLPTLPSVQGYCPTGEAALPLGPTKQAVLCGGQSVLEVVEGSQDWATLGAPTPATRVEREVRVDYVRARAPRYVLVLETSVTMGLTHDWKFINKAVQKLIRHDLPEAAVVGVVTFSNTSRVEAVLTRVGGSRGRLADSVPDRYRLAMDSGRCVLCGINTALKDVLGEDKEGGHLVLVTQGDHATLSLSDEGVLREMAEYYQVKVSSILLPRKPVKFHPFYDELAAVSGGRTTVVVGRGPMERYRELVRALGELVEGGTREVVVEEQLVTVRGEGSITEGSFLVDGTLGRDTQFGIYVEDEEEHLVRSVTLVDSKGREHGPYTRVSTEYDSTNLKTLSFGLGGASPLATAGHVGGRWRYRVAWHRARVAREAAVVVTSRESTAGEGFTLAMWSSSDQAMDIVTASHPLALYLRVTRGGRPVVGARVRVEARLLTDNGTVVALPGLALRDGGEGGPDMLAEDGVYSGHLTDYPGVGRYTFTALVEGAGSVVPATTLERPQALCCGTSTHLAGGEVERLGEWRREARQLYSINLLEVPEGGAVDGLAPGRVIDLGARVEEGGVVLGWTSPGGEGGKGGVAGYRLLRGPSMAALLQGQGALLAAWQREEVAGLRTTHHLPLADRDVEVFLALSGVDAAGNIGPISNMVGVVVPSMEGEGAARTVEAEGVGVEGTEGEGQEEWMMILAICGSFLLLALCLMAGVLYFLRCGQRKVVRATEEATDSSSTSSCTDPKNCSSHRLMPELLAELSSRNLEPRAFAAPPASLPDSTPSYWSASQLLTEHEQRALNSSYGPLPALSPIREELSHHPDLEGVANQGFRVGHGTPVHGLLEPGGRPASVSSDRSAFSGISLLYREGAPPSEEEGESPLRFSTAVQTVAPSTIATLRQNSSYMASIRSRSVSLV